VPKGWGRAIREGRAGVRAMLGMAVWLVLAGLAGEAAAVTVRVDPGADAQRIRAGIASAPEASPHHLPGEAQFHPRDTDAPHFAAGAGAQWLRVILVNPTRAPIERVLMVRFPYLDSVELVARLADGTTRHSAAGPRISQRETPAPFPAFQLSLPPGESAIYLRLDSMDMMMAPLELRSPEAFHRLLLRDHLVIGAVLGAGLVLALYLSLLADGPRDERHAAFLALTLAALGHVLATTGIGKLWFWPEAPVPGVALVFFAQGFVLGTGAWFFRTVLRAGGLPHRVNRVLLFVSFAGFATLLAPLLPAVALPVMQLVAAGAGPTGLLVFALVLWAQGRREAGLLLLGWAPAQAVTLHWYLRSFDLTVYHPGDHYLSLAAYAALIAVYARDLSREAQRAAIAAELDPLTGLGNRTRMERAYRRLCADRGPQGVAVIQIDLDRFKALNDQLGHLAGDEALIEVAVRFRNALRSDDVLCRIGGDEFVVLIPYSGDPGVLETIATRLVTTMAAPIRTGQGAWTLGASIGIAAGQEEPDLAHLQQRADAALYRVKESGRNGYRFAEPLLAVAS
jgi:diguanylate cyclase (GGDEF)-like protein